jgi:hydrogenase maturation protein HypF
VHYLLLAAVAECRAHTPVVLVMTSANLSDEPIVYRDADAFARLGTIADLLLVHNRAIHMRCDDSVMRVIAEKEQFVRRSRGFAPEPVPLAQTCEVPILACGGHLKNTFALSKGQQVFVSHHIGDLDNLETLLSYREGIEHYKTLFGIAPQAIAYDLHPEYLATKYALESDIPTRIGVQHHHAHIASVIAEHGLTGQVIGVAADGTGYGLDGAVWGCEVMLADLCDFTRLAHLAYVPLPGGEQAVRQPWRMAAVYLQQAYFQYPQTDREWRESLSPLEREYTDETLKGQVKMPYGDLFRTLDLPFTQHCDPQSLKIISRMITRGLNTPPTSSLGRLFDAVAALLLIRQEVAYEGQAAIELEIMATQALGAESVLPYPFAYKSGRPALLDVAEMIRAIVDDIQRGTPVAQIALRFHQTIVNLLLEACMQARLQSGVTNVALSGGVFQNKLLLELLSVALQKQSFNVYTNQRVLPNDGGLAYGQLAVAAARLYAAV